jgi:hypothetical protein
MGWISRTQQHRDHNGLRNVCAACGNPATTADPLVNTKPDGWYPGGNRVHRSHTEDLNDGMYGLAQES